MFYLQLDDFQVVGASPEMLVKSIGGHLDYHPIAGTRPRASDEDEDKRLELELKSDEKERAEHIMLLDLGRNDLGRVCKPGTVSVKQRPALVVGVQGSVPWSVASLKMTRSPALPGTL